MTAKQAAGSVEARIAVLQAAKAVFAERNAELSAIAGYSVDFDICGRNRFMLSAKGDKVESLKALAAKMPGVTAVSGKYDERNDCSRCFFAGQMTRNWPDNTNNRTNFFGGKSNGRQQRDPRRNSAKQSWRANSDSQRRVDCGRSGGSAAGDAADRLGDGRDR